MNIEGFLSYFEDRSRIRTGHAPENVGLLRRFVLSLLHKEKTFKGGFTKKAA